MPTTYLAEYDGQFLSRAQHRKEDTSTTALGRVWWSGPPPGQNTYVAQDELIVTLGQVWRPGLLQGQVHSKRRTICMAECGGQSRFWDRARCVAKEPQLN
jgi:hypothetical protein